MTSSIFYLILLDLVDLSDFVSSSLLPVARHEVHHCNRCGSGFCPLCPRARHYLITSMRSKIVESLHCSKDLISIPQQQQPILIAISNSGCPLTDIHCICDNDAFIDGLLQEIPTLCTPGEVQSIFPNFPSNTKN